MEAALFIVSVLRDTGPEAVFSGRRINFLVHSLDLPASTASEIIAVQHCRNWMARTRPAPAIRLMRAPDARPWCISIP
jgi:hypothetical protein